MPSPHPAKANHKLPAMKNSEQLRAIVDRFDTRGTIDNIRPLGNGLINDTFLVTTVEADAPDYVLQRINTNVFADPNGLMDNIEAVTTHIRRKLVEQGADDIDRRVLQFVKASQGGNIHAEGFHRTKTSPLLLEWPSVSVDTSTFWCLCVFIPRSVSKEAVDAPNSRHAGEAFGEFQSLLADLPTPLVETIPDFHNLEFRLRQLNEVVAKDPAGRVGEDAVQRMLDDIRADAPHMTLAEQLYRDGLLPKRACHCDTKVNNILFDEQGRVLCVIDLDTVMPSFIFSDYGDFLRSAANATAEDDPDLSHVQFRSDIFEAFTEGYVRATRPFLTPIERDNLPYAVALFPFMQAVRFLWDYLSGDHYWRCNRPSHNLDRARNQMQLYHIVKREQDALAHFVAKI